jgi:hypothetical protein
VFELTKLAWGRKTARTVTVVGCLMLALFSAAPASADTLALTSLGKGASVTITFAGGRRVTGWAGEINWLLTKPSGFTQAISTYCVDLFDPALNNQTVTPLSTNQLTSTTTPNATAGAGGRAAWLYNTYAGGIAALSNTQSSRNMAAGLQIAIWLAMYSPGAFTVSTSSAIMTLASGYLSTLGGHSSVATFFNAAAGRGQDQISSVPELATILPLGIGLLGFAMYQIRRRRRAEA